MKRKSKGPKETMRDFKDGKLIKVMKKMRTWRNKKVHE